MFTVPTKSAQDVAIEQVAAINAHATASAQNAAHNYQVAFDLVWNNPSSTPQDIFDVLGNEAVQLFLQARACIAYLQAVIPGYQEPVPPYQYTLNEDGTVTCGELKNKPLTEENINNTIIPE